jgi:hypothetical protein
MEPMIELKEPHTRHSASRYRSAIHTSDANSRCTPSLPFTMSTQANSATLTSKPDPSSYGLTTEEVQTLSQKCIEAKERAYC